jgi:hypothetical protein
MCLWNYSDAVFRWVWIFSCEIIMLLTRIHNKTFLKGSFARNIYVKSKEVGGGGMFVDTGAVMV